MAGAMVPGLHGCGSVAPLVQAWPTGQGSHSEASERSFLPEKEPGLQGSGMAAPRGQ